jgi:hypothetical protein
MVEGHRTRKQDVSSGLRVRSSGTVVVATLYVGGGGGDALYLRPYYNP